MPDFAATLLCDGSSDRALIPALRWLLAQAGLPVLGPTWANLTGLRKPPIDLADRMRTALDLYPCNLLFVHRDAEGLPLEMRRDEILKAFKGVAYGALPVVCVVPVRMTEAWLLFDESAIRMAAGNPDGRVNLALPRLERCEEIPDPKALLHEALRTASELTGRRRKKFRPDVQVHRLADLVDDYSPLRRLPAFRALEGDLQAAVQRLR